MAALPFEPQAVPQAPVAKPDVLRREDPRIRLAQLARLHNEAAQTAMLANLLGRAPQAMAAVTLSGVVVAGLSLGAMPPAEVAAWLALVGAGVIALWRAYA